MKAKNILHAFLTCVFLLGALSINAQDKIYVYKSDGNADEYNVADIDSISFTSPTAKVDYSKLVINEVNGVSGQKWFEIYNMGDTEISLNGVTAYYSNSEPASYKITWTGTTESIPAGGYFLAGDLVTGLSANNVTIRLQLRDPKGTTLDTYEKLIDINTGYDAIFNKSHARIPDGTGPWYYTTDGIGTPGATNGTSTEGYIKFGNENEAANFPVGVDYTKLILNEVSGNDKFVEIYNSGTENIPLTGVKLQRNDGAIAGGSEWIGTASDIIPAGAYRLFLFNSFTAGLDGNEAYVGWTVNSGISSGQVLKVAIVDPSGTEVSVFIRGDEPLPAWQSTTGVTQNKTDSYSRMDDGTWAYAAPTPGEPNGTKTSDIVSPGYLTATPAPPTPPEEVDYTKLILNEVSGNDKFVEIYNSGTEDIPLVGVKLQRNDGAAAGGSEWLGITSDTIPAGAYRLFLFNSFTAGLDGNDAYVGWTVTSGISAGQVLKVAIVDPSGTEVSVFIRGDVPLPAWQSTTGVTQNKTDSYSRMDDGTWAYAAPTPGEANGTKTSDIVSPGYLTAQP